MWRSLQRRGEELAACQGIAQGVLDIDGDVPPAARRNQLDLLNGLNVWAGNFSGKNLTNADLRMAQHLYRVAGLPDRRQSGALLRELAVLRPKPTFSLETAC